MNGYTGKILSIDLTGKKITTIPTDKYESWGGGHGMGSAIFFDLVKDKTIDGLNPQNAVTFMTSPLSGTLVPGASARTEVQGIGVQSFPIGWFTRSNFGGRFSSLLKFAGWDGIVIQGKPIGRSGSTYEMIRCRSGTARPCPSGARRPGTVRRRSGILWPGTVNTETG